MKTIFATIILFISVLVLQTITPEITITPVMADTTDINPNGSSELSMLMRTMQKFTNEAKADIKLGKAPGAFPLAFDSIHTAKISENISKSDFYDQFADLYLMSVKNYTSSTTENRVETYNNMVNACLACHSQHCPGPIPVIRKMIVNVE